MEKKTSSKSAGSSVEIPINPSGSKWPDHHPQTLEKSKISDHFNLTPEQPTAREQDPTRPGLDLVDLMGRQEHKAWPGFYCAQRPAWPQGQQ